MGKEKKVRPRKTPIRPTQIQQDQVDPRSLEGSVNTLVQQLQLPELEEKLCGLQALGNVLESGDVLEILVQKNVAKVVAPLLLDENSIVRNAAAGTLKNFSMMSVEASEHLIGQDVITLMIAFFQKYDENWVPKVTKSGNLDEDGDSFLQVINLLRNLCECSELPIKRINEVSLIPILTRCLNRKSFSDDFVVSVLQCLLVIIEDNLKATNDVKILCHDFIKETLSIETSKPVDFLMKSLTVGLFINIEPLASLSCDTINMIVSILSMILSIDLRTPSHNISSILPLMEDVPDPNNHKKNVEDQMEINNLKYLADAVQTAIEVLTNIFSPEEDDSMDIDETSDVDSDIEDTYICSNENGGNLETCLNESISTNLSNAIKSNEILEKLWHKTIPLAENVLQILDESVDGRNLLYRLNNVLCKALFCLNNAIENLPLVALGELPGIYSMWVEVGKLIFKVNINNEDIIESATTVMRAALARIKKEISGQTSNVGDMFKELSVNDIQVMLNGIDQSKNPDIRANLSRMFGDLALVLTSKNNIPNPIELIIAKFLLDRLCKESEFWVLAELIDTIMDMFSEDETDQLALQINLVDRLVVLAQNFKHKSRQQRKSLGEHYAMVNTVAANLPRFIKYKKQRVALLQP